jgi:hypothetical protein
MRAYAREEFLAGLTTRLKLLQRFWLLLSRLLMVELLLEVVSERLHMQRIKLLLL